MYMVRTYLYIYIVASVPALLQDDYTIIEICYPLILNRISTHRAISLSPSCFATTTAVDIPQVGILLYPFVIHFPTNHCAFSAYISFYIFILLHSFEIHRRKLVSQNWHFCGFKLQKHRMLSFYCFISRFFVKHLCIYLTFSDFLINLLS